MGLACPARSRIALFGAIAAAIMVLYAPASLSAAPQSLLVVDANTGATLVGQAAEEPRSPASLTKMMTLYMVFDALERGSATLKTRIKISSRAAAASPSKLGLEAGEDIALEDAIKALITKSANDIAIAIAEHFGGTEETFARAMTAKARELGMPATTFRNASGLPDSGQLTTARDMVTLGLRLYDTFPRYFPLFSIRSFSYGGNTYKSHNTLMLHMAGINGIKTGYTHASGFNLVTSYESDGRHLMAAIFGGDSAASRNAQMRVALTRAVSRASTTKTRRPLLIAQARPKPPAKVAAKPEAAASTASAVAAKTTITAPKPAAVSAPAISAPAVTAEARSQVPPVTPAAVPVPAPVPVVAPVVTPNIQMAKVRAVDVAPLEPPRAPQTVAAVAPTRPQVEPRLEPRREAEPRREVAAVTAKPGSFSGEMPSLAQGFAPAALSPPPPGPARPPSSLNQQHAALSQQAPAPVRMPEPSYRLQGPATVAAAVPPPVAAGRKSGWDVQVGAFATAEEADRHLAAVMAKAGAVVSGHPAYRKPVVAGGKTLQRARFGGFDQTSAALACAELTRQAIACLATKAD